MSNANLMAVACGVNPEDAVAKLAFIDAVTEEGGEAGFIGHYPEMGEAKPVAHMEASLSHYGRQAGPRRGLPALRLEPLQGHVEGDGKTGSTVPRFFRILAVSFAAGPGTYPAP